MRGKEGRGERGGPQGSKVRKASYYVWFLGAEECRGLRGPECVRPVVQHLVGRERDHEPDKVTLQVSGRGIKLVQAGRGAPTKHFIPASAVTYVQQEARPEDDLVSAILLIYNPLTRCPVHVHTYRTDSTETAALLRGHLAQLVDRPDQQAKLQALEARLAARGLLPTPAPSRASDGASTGSSSSGGGSSGRSPGAQGPNMASLYDSLAAELREKLGGRGAPLLLPPKDYDTMSRSRGRVDPRRPPTRKTLEDDSARSSGIGSDDAPSPTHEHLDHQSSSDEEWATHGFGEGDTGLLPRNPQAPSAPRGASRGPQHHLVPRSASPSRQRHRHHSPLRGRHPSPSRPLAKDASPVRAVQHRRTPPHRVPLIHRDRSESPISPRERFQDARDKFRSLEREWQRQDSRDSRQDSRDSRDSRQDLSQCSRPRGVSRTPSWEAGAKPLCGSREGRDHGSREDCLWPKSDRDTGYGSRDGLLRDRPRGRDYDRGYGTCDTRDSDPWHRDMDRRTPDLWQKDPRAPSPGRHRGRSPTRDYRVPRVRSPERQDYQRAKSMHDLSQRRLTHDEEHRAANDPRRRSMYDSADDPRPLRDSRVGRIYRSHASIQHRPNSCSSDSCHSLNSYNELPETRRFPGLDRATARPDPLDQQRSPPHLAHKRTYDYPVNGGTAALHISRANHDDYRRFRYDHTTTPQFVRSTSVPSGQY